MAQQDDYYYEIQLTNKQLVFYFMAGATGLVLSFLSGVMVGRGVDRNVAGGAEPRSARSQPQQEERLAESPLPEPSPTELTYARRLEGERHDEGLAKPETSPKPVATLVPTPATTPTPAPSRSPKPSPSPRPSGSPSSKPSPSPPVPPSAKPSEPPASPKASPSPRSEPSAKPPSPPPASPRPGVKEGFTIQVGAFKDRAAADSVTKRLKDKGYPASVSSVESGLFSVSVGPYSSRPEAERVRNKLRDQEKFKPFIVKN